MSNVAEGWSTAPRWGGSWTWSAFYGGTCRNGTASSRRAAEAAARAAIDELRPHTIQGETR